MDHRYVYFWGKIFETNDIEGDAEFIIWAPGVHFKTTS